MLFAGLQATVQNFRVEGSSMAPTLQEGQYLLVNKLVYYHIDLGRIARFVPFLDAGTADVAYPFHGPQRGEVVVFRFPQDPTRDFVKRVIAIPGDAVEVRFGRVYVNGAPLDEPYVLEPAVSTYPLKVLGPDEYFVLGDNRRHSNDSRNWGAVPLENIIGRAWATYWPVGRIRFF